MITQYTGFFSVDVATKGLEAMLASRAPGVMRLGSMGPMIPYRLRMGTR